MPTIVLPGADGDGHRRVSDHTPHAVPSFILGAVLSPGTDVVSQAMMAGPMLILYALSIGIAWLFAKRKPRKRASQDCTSHSIDAPR